MKRGSVIWDGTGKVLAEDAHLTENMFERMRGLLGRPPLGKGEGMMIRPCSSVHTFGMTSDIDLVFISPMMEATKLVKRVRPFRIAWDFGAKAVLELWPGAIDEVGLVRGARLKWEDSQ